MKDSHVDAWERIFDLCYQRASGASDKLQNFTGWKSSYSMGSIPADEMREWVRETVDRILEGKPRNIYEIGAGVGLIMFPLLDRCKSYCATDLSREAVEYLKKHTPGGREGVSYYQRPADDLGDVEVGKYETFVLNSVVQYFPSIEYLERVIEGIMNCIGGEGVIFLGDIRDHRLLKHFHSSVAIYQAEDGTDPTTLRKNIEKRIANDSELTLDPDFFIGLKSKHPQISHIEMRLKRGMVQNELTKFRYDVLIYLGKSSPPQWSKIEWDRDEKRLLGEAEKHGGRFQIVNIPNFSVLGIDESIKLIDSGEDLDIQKLKALNDFGQARAEWEALYSLFSSGYRVEPILDASDPVKFSLYVEKSQCFDS
ncbi:MAG: class I SAM-dependent methyltransferase [Chlamydiia bacterium]|nr:class I SAM-dependent methyltransferase [Chlamydiia bacterium]